METTINQNKQQSDDIDKGEQGIRWKTLETMNWRDVTIQGTQT
jgi:hypothetical protein